MRRTASRRLLVAALVLAALLPAACARGTGGSPGSGSVSPLTGLPADPNAPVLAVKVDNTPAGRPWSGIEDADVVYVEPVEGGATRLLAIFSSRVPTTVGPVRSFRESDLTVLAAYGRPALAYSGSAPELDGLLARAPIAAVSPATAAGAYRRDAKRSPPENLYADPAELLAAASDATPPRDVGFRFGPAPAGGRAMEQRRVSVRSAQIGLAWNAQAGRWMLSFGGGRATTAGGGPVGAATVLVQNVATRASSVRDAAGAVSPYAETVGSGTAEVLRDGQVFPARWSRPSPQSGTTVTGTDGADLPFAPGPVWVLLVPRD